MEKEEENRDFVMSSASAMVAAGGNGLQMYDTSCSYQQALDLKSRMSSGGGMTPMTSAVGTNLNFRSHSITNLFYFLAKSFNKNRKFNSLTFNTYNIVLF